MSIRTCSLCRHLYKVRYEKQRLCPACLGAKRSEKKMRQEIEDWERHRQPIPGAPPPLVQRPPVKACDDEDSN